MRLSVPALVFAAALLTACGGEDSGGSTESLSGEELSLVEEVHRFAQGPSAVGDIDRWVDASDAEILTEAKDVCDDMARVGVPSVMDDAYTTSGGPRGTKVYELFVATECPGLSVNVEAWYSSVPKYYRLENDPAYVEFFDL